MIAVSWGGKRGKTPTECRVQARERDRRRKGKKAQNKRRKQPMPRASNERACSLPASISAGGHSTTKPLGWPNVTLPGEHTTSKVPSARRVALAPYPPMTRTGVSGKFGVSADGRRRTTRRLSAQQVTSRFATAQLCTVAFMVPSGMNPKAEAPPAASASCFRRRDLTARGRLGRYAASEGIESEIAAGGGIVSGKLFFFISRERAVVAEAEGEEGDGTEAVALDVCEVAANLLWRGGGIVPTTTSQRATVVRGGIT